MQASDSETLPEIALPDDLPPLVKPGVYELAFVSYTTAMMFMGKAPKLIMTFRIITLGNEHFGAELMRYYNVKRIYGKPQRHGRFKPAATGAFIREYMSLFTGRVSRRDRIPMSHFQNVVIEGKVETVKRSNGKDIPEELQYSVIRELRRVKQ